MDRIGEPYVTSRRRQRANVEGEGQEASGLGLGFFIAKTLLERSGATLDFENRAFPDRGAVVRVHWGRNDFERPMAFATVKAPRIVIPRLFWPLNQASGYKPELFFT